MLVAIVGATGTGKSALSLEIAHLLAATGTVAEVVNADAMQLYRGMDIGTAKLPVNERRGIRHHLLDVLEVTEEASVARYQSDAVAAVGEIEARGAVAILVGGSGLYVSSVLFDFRFPATDAGVRARLEDELAEYGAGELHRRLARLDPAAAKAIGPSNGRRIVRALEVVELTGEPFGSGLPDEARYRRPTTVIGLRAPRQELVRRLDARVAGMWDGGLVEEARALISTGLERGATAGRAIGYAQALAQLRGEITRDSAVGEAAALTRRYARRQVSWFKRYREVNWIDHDDPQRAAIAVRAVGHD